MQLGWIDFSQEDRKKTLDVISLLQEKGAVDELGIGIVRDAFANFFFPGTSTVQTRAKYFLIVPYAIKDVTLSKKAVNKEAALKLLDNIERDCGKAMLGGDGVIGRTVLPYGWVSRTPSAIYWAGIRKYGICKYPSISIGDIFQISAISLKEKNSAKKIQNKSDDATGDTTDFVQDDSDAGDIDSYQFFNIPCYKPEWKENLTIELTTDEAHFLASQILRSVPDTLLSFILKNNISLDGYDSFENFAMGMKYIVPSNIRELLVHAVDFNKLVFAGRVRYNVILSRGQNDEANAIWDEISKTMTTDINVDLNAIFSKLQIRRGRTYLFLTQLQQYIKSGDVNKIDSLLINNERNLKGDARAKLLHPNKYDPQEWVGGTYLDYRFFDAKTIVDDIYRGLK